MNKDEKKMIEDMTEVISQATNECFATECKDCRCYRANDDYYRCKSVFEAEALYDANCRIIADDEIVIKRGTGAMVELLNQEMNELLSNAGYRKIADDEVVLTKGAYESISNKAKANVVKALAIKQETREILRELKNNIILVDFGCGDGVYEVVDMDTKELKELAQKHGIELE